MTVAPDFAQALWRGGQRFDAGAFFEAHEAWEERWRLETDRESRLFLQGLIQIAAGFHKLGMRGTGGPAGVVDSASRLLARGLAKLDGCAELVAAHGLAAFCDDVRSCARRLPHAPAAGTPVPALGLGARR